jgi:hypothetical protein
VRGVRLCYDAVFFNQIFVRLRWVLELLNRLPMRLQDMKREEEVSGQMASSYSSFMFQPATPPALPLHHLLPLSLRCDTLGHNHALHHVVVVERRAVVNSLVRLHLAGLAFGDALSSVHCRPFLAAVMRSLADACVFGGRLRGFYVHGEVAVGPEAEGFEEAVLEE